MSAIAGHNDKSEPVQLRLVEGFNQAQEAHGEPRRTSKTTNTLSKSNTPTETGSQSQGMFLGFMSLPPIVTVGRHDSSLNSGTAIESPSPRRSEAERKAEIEERRRRIHAEVEEMVQQYPPGQGMDREAEQAIELRITVNAYGNPERAMDSVLLNMGRALHHAFGDDFKMQMMDGVEVIYDSLAHDGEHVGHEEALKLRRFK